MTRPIKTAMLQIRCTPELAAAVAARGGFDWVRDLLEAATHVDCPVSVLVAQRVLGLSADAAHAALLASVKAGGQ